MTLKKWQRHSYDSLVSGSEGDKHGNLFVSKAGQVNLEKNEYSFHFC